MKDILKGISCLAGWGLFYLFGMFVVNVVERVGETRWTEHRLVCIKEYKKDKKRFKVKGSFKKWCYAEFYKKYPLYAPKKDK